MLLTKVRSTPNIADLRVVHEEETLVDEPIPRLPLSVQTIRVKIKIGGSGKPTFRAAETEIDF